MLTGINAAVVGILLAALYRPVFTDAVHQWHDAVFAITVFAILMSGKVPAWLLAFAAAALGAAFTLL